MEGYAKKKGIIYTVYKAIFRPVSDLNKKQSKRLKIPSYKKLEGKVIRAIYITTLDPFGFDIHDTAVQPTNFFTKAGDKLHLKTLRFAIRDQLLFRDGDAYDDLKIKESERILRLSPYIKDVEILPVKAGKDSVDIYIREIDVWTAIVKISSLSNNTKIELLEEDFLGTGHQLDNSIRFEPNKRTIYEGIYTIPDFKNTFITTTLFLKSDFDSVFHTGISLNRPFYSPLAKWAGGISVSHTTTSDTLFNTDVIKTIPNVRFNQFDMWAGKSWRLFKGNSDVSRITNVVLTARYLNNDFISNPLPGTDPLGIITDERFYLAGLGISQRIYIKDKYIFKFGLPEDVPTGQVLSLTIGRQNKGVVNRLYIGGRIGWGNYIGKGGYLAANLEYGTFRNGSRLEEGVFSADITYFTNILEIGRWKIRQFIKPRLMIGLRRLPTETLTINKDRGIQGFSSDVLYGTKRFVISTQTQLYAPYCLWGFRFAPILYFTGALIAADNVSIFRSRLYSAIGIGILIKNEMLVLNTFQIAIAFYPVIPGYGNNLLKLNSIKTYDFQFRDFDLEKPGTVIFQ